MQETSAARAVVASASAIAMMARRIKMPVRQPGPDSPAPLQWPPVDCKRDVSARFTALPA
jgi:hypothetical protein